MGKISRQKIDEILERTDIAAIISARVDLKNIGMNRMRGLCPFHQEKTPSFTVYQDSHSYHCFGCAANGTVIDWVMHHDGLGYQEAVLHLAKQCGVDISYITENDQQEQVDPQLALLEELGCYFQQSLGEHPQAPTARDYLLQRKIQENMQHTFRLGFAPPGWDNLAKLWQGKQEKLDLARTLGLIKVKREGDVGYDAFRERLIFPICDFRGKIVGFGGRSLHEDQQPKYLNSSESDVFSKGRLVYGEYQARAAGTIQSWLVVEGYMDVIRLHQHGFTHAVACLGTAITTQQIRHLLRVATSLCFVFDGDDAGRQAAIKAMKLCTPFVAPAHDFSFVLLPNNEDPDSLLCAHGQEYFQDYLTHNTRAWSDFFHSWVIAKFDVATAEGKLRVLSLAEKELETLENRDMRTLLLTRIRSELGIGYVPKRQKTQQPKLLKKISNRAKRLEICSIKLLAASMHSPEIWVKVKHNVFEYFSCVQSHMPAPIMQCLAIVDQPNALVQLVGLLHETQRQQFTDFSHTFTRAFTTHDLEELAHQVLYYLFHEIDQSQRNALLQRMHARQQQRHALLCEIAVSTTPPSQEKIQQEQSTKKPIVHHTDTVAEQRRQSTLPLRADDTMIADVTSVPDYAHSPEAGVDISSFHEYSVHAKDHLPFIDDHVQRISRNRQQEK